MMISVDKEYQVNDHERDDGDRNLLNAEGKPSRRKKIVRQIAASCLRVFPPVNRIIHGFYSLMLSITILSALSLVENNFWGNAVFPFYLMSFLTGVAYSCGSWVMHLFKGRRVNHLAFFIRYACLGISLLYMIASLKGDAALISHLHLEMVGLSIIIFIGLLDGFSFGKSFPYQERPDYLFGFAMMLVAALCGILSLISFIMPYYAFFSSLVGGS